MRRSFWVLTFVFLAALVAISQTSTISGPEFGIAGVVDPMTGTFTPVRGVPLPARGAATTAATTYGGKLVFNFTVAVKSVIPATDTISCRASVIIADGPLTLGLVTLVQESASVTATRNGTTAACSVAIPYSWTLSNGPTDQMSISYSLSAGGLATAGNPFQSRTTGQGLGSFPIPANGTTSTFTVKETM